MAIPIISAGDGSVPRGRARLASGLFTLSTTDDTEVTLYEFWDSGTAENSGYFSINSIAQPSGAPIAIEAGSLNLVEFVGGSVAGTETVWVRAQAGGEFSDWVSWTMATTGTAPAASAAGGSAHANQSVAAADLFSANAADGEPIASYEFWDGGTAQSSGHFSVSGTAQAAGTGFVVAASLLGDVTYVGGTANGSETVWVRAADAWGFGDWISWTMLTGNTTAVVSAPNTTIARGAMVDVATLFSVLDAEGDTASAYEFWDSGITAGSGFFSVDTTPKPAGSSILVEANQLNLTTLTAGSIEGTETLWMRAYDGFDWGLWTSFTLTTTNRPMVTVSNTSVGRNLARAATGLYTVMDADGDAITQVEFWDSGTEANSGYFTVTGVTKTAGTGIIVAAADLGMTQFVGGSGPGTETLWVRAHDGTDWGAWVSFTMNTTGSAPVVNAANAEVPTGHNVLVSTLFSVSDADGDAIPQYEFWDSGTTPDSGHFTIDGVMQGAGISIPVASNQLDLTNYVGGSVLGAELVWVRANDGAGWSNWASWMMATAP